MKGKRLGPWIAIALIAAALAVSWLLRGPPEPVYQGKTATEWFREYAYRTNVMPQLLLLSISPDGWVDVFQRTSAPPSLIRFRVQTNDPNWSATLRSRFQYPRGPADESLTALRQLGTNAVPCLLRQIRVTPFDRAYGRLVTNLPAGLQRKLPSPADKLHRQMRAMSALESLGSSARAATPELLKIVEGRDLRLRRWALTALRQIYADRTAVSGLLLQLGARRRYTEVIEIVNAVGWTGPEVAQLLGEILRSTNATILHRDAIRLLEARGEEAAPAWRGILAGLGSSDSEVRYLSVRALETILKQTAPGDHPQMAQTLQRHVEDKDAMVRTVSRRILARLSEGIDAAAGGPAQSAQ